MMSSVPLFTATHAALLQAFLSEPERPSGTLTYPQVAGFLFSITNGPELILPSEWMPMIFNDGSAAYETQQDAERVMHAMMALYNDCEREPTGESPLLPPGCEVKPLPLANLEVDAPLSQWAQGFSIGYDYLEEVWDAYVPAEFDEDLGASLMVLTFFSSPQLAKAYHEESKGTHDLEQLARTVIEILPDAMREYACLGRAIYRARREAGDLDQGPPALPKIGRNDPCPCGSGKKFKKCCGATN